MRVQLLATCLVDQLFPRVGLAAAAVLERCGVQVTVPPGQTCCGQPALNAGFTDEARRMARHTIDVLAADDAPVVVPSGSCTDMIVHHAPALLAGEPSYASRARAVAARTHELSQFLVDVLKRPDCGACLARSAAYHPSCHSLRALGVDRQPRELLANVRGLERRALPNAETCCGFGGLFAVKMSEVSGAMLERKIASIEESGAETVIATDMSCLMHIAGGLRRKGSPVQVMHLAEVLAATGGGVAASPKAAGAGPGKPKAE
ncbi:MAG TPA: (Fe-S)-binding protein [Vicinamibacterales bacterium]|nr:(Fe-S)-binding protein [Vicinamibacterales bacterium]